MERADSPPSIQERKIAKSTQHTGYSLCNRMRPNRQLRGRAATPSYSPQVFSSASRAQTKAPLGPSPSFSTANFVISCPSPTVSAREQKGGIPPAAQARVTLSMHTRNNTDYTEEPNSHHRAFTADEVQPKRFGVQQPFRQQPICAHTPALAPQQSSSDDPRYSSSYPWIAPSPVPVCPDNSGSSLYWEVRRAQDGEGQPMPQMKPSRSPAHPTPPPLFGAPSLCRGIPAYRNEGRYRRARAEEDGGSAWRAQTGNKTYAGGQADGGEPWPPLLLWTQRDGPRSARHSPPPLRKPRQTADPGPPPHLCSLSSLAAGGREERERSDSPIEAPRGLSERHREGRKDRERGSTDVGAPASPSLASPRPTITHRAADRSRQYPLRDPAAQTRTTTTTNTKTDFVQQDEGDSVLSAPPTIISASRIPPRLPSSLRHSHSPPYSPLNRDPTYPHLTAAIAADRDKNRESPEPVPPFAFTGMRGSRMPHASRDRGGGFEEHSRADRQTEGDKRKWGLREAVKEYRQSFEGGEGEQQRDYSQEPEPARRQKETEERSEMSALSAHCCLSPTPTRTPPLKQGEREVNHRLHSSHPSSASAVLKKKQMEGGKRSCSTPATTSFLLQNSAVRAPSPSMERVAVSISTHTLSPPCHGRPMLPASTGGVCCAVVPSCPVRCCGGRASEEAADGCNGCPLTETDRERERRRLQTALAEAEAVCEHLRREHGSLAKRCRELDASLRTEREQTRLALRQLNKALTRMDLAGPFRDAHVPVFSLLSANKDRERERERGREGKSPAPTPLRPSLPTVPEDRSETASPSPYRFSSDTYSPGANLKKPPPKRIAARLTSPPRLLSSAAAKARSAPSSPPKQAASPAPPLRRAVSFNDSELSRTVEIRKASPASHVGAVKRENVVIRDGQKTAGKIGGSRRPARTQSMPAGAAPESEPGPIVPSTKQGEEMRKFRRSSTLQDGSPVSPQQVLTPTRGNTGQRPIDNWRDGKWIRRGESWIWESAKWKFEDGRWLAMDWDGTASDQFGMGPSKSAANLEGALVDDDATEDGASPTRAEGDGEEEGEWRLVGDEWVYVQGEWAYRQGEWVAADDVEIPNRDGAQMNQAAPSVPSSDPSRDNAAGVVKRDGDADASVVADGEPEGEWRLNEDGAWVYECPGWVYVNGGWQAIGD